MIRVYVKHFTKLVPKGRPKVGKWGVYTPAKTRAFEKELQMVFKLLPNLAKKKQGNFGYALPITEPCVVEITFFFAKPKSVTREFHSIRPDIDNLCKSIFDSANKILWVDDCQIINLVAGKKYSDNHTEGFIMKVLT